MRSQGMSGLAFARWQLLVLDVLGRLIPVAQEGVSNSRDGNKMGDVVFAFLVQVDGTIACELVAIRSVLRIPRVWLGRSGDQGGFEEIGRIGGRHGEVGQGEVVSGDLEFAQGTTGVVWETAERGGLRRVVAG